MADCVMNERNFPDKPRVLVVQTTNGNEAGGDLDQEYSHLKHVAEINYGDDIDFSRTTAVDNFANWRKQIKYIGETIEYVSTMDAIIFGSGWETSRACRIINETAAEYSMETIESHGDWRDK